MMHVPATMWRKHPQTMMTPFFLFPLILCYTHGFVVLVSRGKRWHATGMVLHQESTIIIEGASDANDDASAATNSTAAASSVMLTLPDEAIRLRKELLELGDNTKRGFKASQSERKRAKELIHELSQFNPTNDSEPLSPYYPSSESPKSTTAKGLTLTGKWTLVYTDAPDITSLDTSSELSFLLPPAAKLGRIGQECTPPFIKNVIEWKRPDWMSWLPFSGTQDSRILQKVVTEGTASSTQNNPLEMNLKLVGIELSASATTTKMAGSNSTTPSSLQDAIQQDGLPAALLQRNPVELRGPLTAPFGMFTLLYLDESLRIIKTGQGYYAVNVRADDYGQDECWF
jgi:hypothetical protein